MRDYRYDYIRSLAILLVVMVHTRSMSGIEGMYLWHDGIYDALVYNGVPLFIMLSGALVLGGKPIEIHQFYRQRFSRLLIPFLVWSALVYVLSYLIGKYPDINSPLSAVTHYIPYLLENRINTAYWYVQMIAVLYLLTPLIQPAVQTMSKRNLGGFIAGGIIALGLVEYYPQAYWTQFTSHLLSPLLCYLTGYWLRDDMRPSLCVAGLAVGILGTWFCQNAVFTWLEAASLFGLMRHLPNRPSRVIETISKTSYDTYLMHFVLITPLFRLIHWDANTAPIWQQAMLPFIAAVAILAVCVIGLYSGQQAFRYMKSK